jgi:PHD/YefM family antitoxin component YafN of YafNO toxin-antitoxin module
MATAEIRNRIYSVIKAMPLEKLDAALAFLEDLQRSSEEETALLLGDASFMRDYREAKEDIRSRRTVNLKAIRRDV